MSGAAETEIGAALCPGLVISDVFASLSVVPLVAR